MADHGGRLLDRDGTFNAERRGLSTLDGISPYHWLLQMRWPAFLLMVGLAYLAINLFFAGLYLLCGEGALVGQATGLGDGPRAHVARAFFFSVQTFSTVGYGAVLPHGWWANWIMVVQSISGLFGIALATGLVFARFSLPRAKILFSRKAVVGPAATGRAFMFQLTNSRRAELVDLHVRVVLARFDDRDVDRGATFRRFELLRLERDTVSFFPLAWTVVHPIDENSPFAELDSEGLRRQRAEVLVMLSGLDRATSQTVHARTSFDCSEIEWNARFVDLFVNRDPAAGPISIDVDRIHLTEPADEDRGH